MCNSTSYLSESTHGVIVPEVEVPEDSKGRTSRKVADAEVIGSSNEAARAAESTDCYSHVTWTTGNSCDGTDDKVAAPVAPASYCNDAELTIDTKERSGTVSGRSGTGLGNASPVKSARESGESRSRVTGEC